MIRSRCFRYSIREERGEEALSDAKLFLFEPKLESDSMSESESMSEASSSRSWSFTVRMLPLSAVVAMLSDDWFFFSSPHEYKPAELPPAREHLPSACACCCYRQS